MKSKSRSLQKMRIKTKMIHLYKLIALALNRRIRRVELLKEMIRIKLIVKYAHFLMIRI